MDSFSFNESTSLRSITGAWNEAIGPGDQALSISRMALGYQQREFSVDYIQRYDIYYSYANDTANLLYQVENRLPLPVGNSYRLFIEAKRSTSEGMRLGYSWKVNEKLTFKPGLSLLRPKSLQLGVVSGEAVALAAGDYDFNFTSDLAYDEDPLYSRPAQGLNGDGYALDFSVAYRINDKWQGKLDLVDIAGKLEIPNAPYTEANASSDIKRFDADGYVIYDPAVTGQEGFRPVQFDFDRQTHLQLSYQFDPQYSLILQHHALRGFEYQQVNLQRFFSESAVSLQFIPQPAAMGIDFRSAHISAGFITDHLQADKMQLLQFNIQFAYSF